MCDCIKTCTTQTFLFKFQVSQNGDFLISIIVVGLSHVMSPTAASELPAGDCVENKGDLCAVEQVA